MNHTGKTGCNETPPGLSVVLPAYNEDKRIGGTIERIREYLIVAVPDHEIIVVDDGSGDGTRRIVAKLSRRHPQVELVSLGRHCGKGAAVRAGVFASRGEAVLVCDADLATPIEAVELLEGKLAEGYDIAIGSRSVADNAFPVHQTVFRRVIGRGFNLLVQATCSARFKDTQCGFKLFRHDVAKELFEKAKIDGYAYDVEILLLSKGYHRIAEVAVPWCHISGSKVSPLCDGLRMAWDLLKLSRTLPKEKGS